MGDTHTHTHTYWPKRLSNKNTVPYIALLNGTHTHTYTQKEGDTHRIPRLQTSAPRQTYETFWNAQRTFWVDSSALCTCRILPVTSLSWRRTWAFTTVSWATCPHKENTTKCVRITSLFCPPHSHHLPVTFTPSFCPSCSHQVSVPHIHIIKSSSVSHLYT